jgi:hypothetical protein
MNDWKHKKETIKRKSINNYSELIYRNPFFKRNSHLIPLIPLKKNLFILKHPPINIDKLLLDLVEIEKLHKWTDKDKIHWQSITLKSIDGCSHDFLVKTELGIGTDNKYKYTELMESCPYIKSLLENIGTDIYLVRLLKLKAKNKIKFHTDEIVFKNTSDIIRCHIPIITHHDVSFKLGYPLNAPAPGYNVWNAYELYGRYLSPGYLWYTNVNCLHSVENNSDIDRVHLVIDLRPTPDMLTQIHN